jgi:tetratricopeptide (TPR) repeat protein
MTLSRSKTPSSSARYWLNGMLLSTLLALCLTSSAFAGKLDVEGRDLTAQDVRLMGGLVDHGVLVTNSTGNAKSAGLQNDDIIISINGHRINGVFDMEEILSSIRGLRFNVDIKRIERRGLLKAQNLEFTIESAVDLQIKKALTIDLGEPSRVSSGFYQGRAALMWHANGVLAYSRKLDKEEIVSLLKVYSIAEHKVYRYVVPDNIVQSTFLTNNGLLLYVSALTEGTKIGVIDVNAGERRLEWSLDLPKLSKKPYCIKLKDINGDNTPEIFYSFKNSITCIDGITGNVVWVRDDLKTFFMDERNIDDKDVSDIVVADFNRNGIIEVSAGPLLLSASTGEKVGYLSFDPVRYYGGILECRQLIGDPIPDVLTHNGLVDGNSGQKTWEPLRSRQYILSDLNGDQRFEIIYLLGDNKLHVHDISSHRELYSLDIEGNADLDIKDFNQDGFSDILIRSNDKAYLYQTNIPVDSAVLEDNPGIGYAASLMDYGLRKDKFFIFARELYQKEAYDDSIPLFLRALSDTDVSKNEERSTDIVRYLASAFMRTGNVEGALGLLRRKEGALARRVLQDFASEIVSYLLDRNETWQAINFLEMSKDDDPLLLARCYLAVGRPEVAVKLLTEMESKPTEAQLLLGRSYVLMGQPISARIAFKNFLKYFPTSAEGWKELGSLEAAEKQWDDSEEAFTICQDLDPIQGQLALSAFYLLDSPKKNLDQALSKARSAHRIEVSSRTRLQLAEALVEDEQYRSASRLLSQVSDPGMEFNRFEKLSQRCMYQIQAEDKYDEAEKLLLSPVFKKRNDKKAIDLLHEILDRYPKALVFPMVHFRLGEVYLSPEHRDEAKAVYHFARVTESKHFLVQKAKERLGLLDNARMSKSIGEETLRIETVPLTSPDTPMTQPPAQEEIIDFLSPMDGPIVHKLEPPNMTMESSDQVSPSEISPSVKKEPKKGRRHRTPKQQSSSSPIEVLILDD